MKIPFGNFDIRMERKLGVQVSLLCVVCGMWSSTGDHVESPLFNVSIDDILSILDEE